MDSDMEVNIIIIMIAITYFFLLKKYVIKKISKFKDLYILSILNSFAIWAIFLDKSNYIFFLNKKIYIGALVVILIIFFLKYLLMDKDKVKIKYLIIIGCQCFLLIILILMYLFLYLLITGAPFGF